MAISPWVDQVVLLDIDKRHQTPTTIEKMFQILIPTYQSLVIMMVGQEEQ
jgi:hypothetical protein